MYTATALFDVKLPDDSRSLKAKRSYIRPIIAALRRFDVAVAEVGCLDRYGRTEIGVAAVGVSVVHVQKVIETCDRFMASRPEIELLSVHRGLFGANDDI